MASLPKSAVAVAAMSVMLTATACSGGSGGSGDATIRFADSLPESHFISENFSQRFIKTAERLAEEEGVDLEIEFFPDGQLGDPEDQIDNMTNGVFDMALISPSYSPDQMPAGDVFNLPQMAGSAETLAKAYYELMIDNDSTLREADFEDNELTPVAGFALPLYQMALTSEIDGIDAMDGAKIRSGGGTQDATIETLGGNPVTLTTSEQYEGLQRGIIDGGIFNTPSMIDNKTAEVLTSFTTNADLASFVGGLAMSQSTWDGLSEPVQQILTEAGQDATNHFAGVVDQLGRDAQQSLVKDYDLTAVELSDAELEDLQERVDPLDDAWVDAGGDLDRAAVLEEAHEAIEDNG